MNKVLDSLGRALAYSMHPRVIALSVLPLFLMVVLAWGASYWFWDLAVARVRGLIFESSLFAMVWKWFEVFGVGDLKSVIAPLVVIFGVTPLVVVFSLLAVSMLMTPALVNWVATRRFPQLARLHGGGWLASLGWSMLSVLIAVFTLLLTLPLWLIPPLAVLIPPLVWGWLTYRILTFDVLAEHASREERLAITRQHRLSLLTMGVLTGLMGAAPSLVWASGALLAAAFVILVPLAVWLYTWVFAFSSLWFAHFALSALQALRHKAGDQGAARVTSLEPTTPKLELASDPSASTPP